MSHIVEIQTEVRDQTAVKAACKRLHLPQPQHETVKLFQKEVTGLTVRLRNWQFPVVCQLKSGRLQYDNYGGRWGKQEELGQFLQAYAVEATKIEARRKGHTVTEQKIDGGAIRLVVNVGA